MIFSLIGNCRFGPLLSFSSHLGSLRSTDGHCVSIFRFYTQYFFSRFTFDFKIGFFRHEVPRFNLPNFIFDDLSIITDMLPSYYFRHQNQTLSTHIKQISSSETDLWWFWLMCFLFLFFMFDQICHLLDIMYHSLFYHVSFIIHFSIIYHLSFTFLSCII